MYVEADVASCEERDPKGLYKKARSGLVKNFTGIDAPYEAPLNPEMVINTKCQTVDESVEQLLAFVTKTFPQI